MSCCTFVFVCDDKSSALCNAFKLLLDRRVKKKKKKKCLITLSYSRFEWQTVNEKDNLTQSGGVDQKSISLIQTKHNDRVFIFRAKIV